MPSGPVSSSWSATVNAGHSEIYVNGNTFRDSGSAESNNTETDLCFKIVPDAGYRLLSVYVNGLGAIAGLVSSGLAEPYEGTGYRIKKPAYTSGEWTITAIVEKIPFTVGIDGGLDVEGTIRQGGTPVALSGHTHTAADVGAMTQKPQKIEISSPYGYISMGGKALQYEEYSETIACVPVDQAGDIYPCLAPFGCDTPSKSYHAANKAYVDELFNRVAPVIVTVQVTRGSGSNATVQNHNVKCYPAETGVSSYSINFSFTLAEGVSPSAVKVIPPEQYAFTGLYWSSGIILEYYPNGMAYGRVDLDGTVWFDSGSSSNIEGASTITGSFTLEVA